MAIDRLLANGTVIGACNIARDAVEKATWSQMANRWQACAKYYEDQLSALEIQAETRRRKTH